MIAGNIERVGGAACRVADRAGFWNRLSWLWAEFFGDQGGGGLRGEGSHGEGLIFRAPGWRSSWGFQRIPRFWFERAGLPCLSIPSQFL